MIPLQSLLICLFGACQFAGSLLWTICLNLRVSSNSQRRGRQNRTSPTTTHSRQVPPSVCTSYLSGKLPPGNLVLPTCGCSDLLQGNQESLAWLAQTPNWFDCRVWGFRWANLPCFGRRFPIPAGQLLLISNMALIHSWI